MEDWLDIVRRELPYKWWPYYESDCRHLVSTDPPPYVDIAHDNIRKHRPPHVFVDHPWPRRIGYGSVQFQNIWWDGPVGLAITHKLDVGIPTKILAVALEKIGSKELAVLQIQTASSPPNKWLFRLRPDPRSFVIRALARCLPDWSFATPDGQQKVNYLLYLHGGFTEAELEDMEWEEWGEGEEVCPRVRRQYDRCPIGYEWGEPVLVNEENETWARRLLPKK